MGQGDCTLVACNDEYMLIDAGEAAYGETVVNYLNSIGVDKLDYVVATHPHSDHIGGMAKVLENFETEILIETPMNASQLPDNSLYADFCEAVADNGCDIDEAYSGMTFSVGKAKVEILGPVTDDVDDLNDMSIVMTVTYGTNVFLLTADAEEGEELTLVEEDLIPDCDLLKVGHHGSSGSSCEEFLKSAKPEICVIEVGKQNDYGHPSDKTLERISAYTKTVYRTDFCGNIIAESDGKNISISYD